MDLRHAPSQSTQSHINDSVDCLISKLEALKDYISGALEELYNLKNANATAQGNILEHASASTPSETTTTIFEKTVRHLRTRLTDSINETERLFPTNLDNLADSNQLKKSDVMQISHRKPYVLNKPLQTEDYNRYGRQLIMPEIGARGQLRLQNASVLIIGIGGLGCPAATYLAGAGIGKIGLVDGDIVELSNLHRQILHSTKDVGSFKVDSAIRSLKKINPNVCFEAYKSHVDSENIWEFMADYDLILDCTDHPTSRYLISDAAVILSKSLVSASALRVDGQLMVLNHPAALPGDPSGGPCYRCIFPRPPPPESVVSCGEGGILGPVVGVLGILQALETIRILVRSETDSIDEPSLLLYSALGKPPFRTVRLRGRKSECVACSKHASVTRHSIATGTTNYAQFCGITEQVQVLEPQDRISSRQFAQDLMVSPSQTALLIDVRDNTQFELCNMSGSINIPFTDIIGWKTKEDIDDRLIELCKQSKPITFVCRYGNDSQLAVQQIRHLGLCRGQNGIFKDLDGGWRSWRLRVDSEWPDY